MNERKSAAIVLVVVLLFCLPGLAQDQPKRVQLGSTLDGAAGLFKTMDAEPLRPGDFNFSLGYDYFNRDPGKLNFQNLPAGFGIGLFERFELYGAVDASRRVKASGIRYYRVLPGQLPRLASTSGGGTLAYNDAPFIDVPDARGLGDVRFGLKVNFLSERRGDSLGMSFLTFMHVPTHESVSWLNRGLGTGEISGGAGLLFSKRGGDKAQLHLNTLIHFQPGAYVNAVKIADLQSYLTVRGGGAFPASGNWQVITEVDGRVFFGSKTQRLNPRSPVDVIVGLRAYPREWMSVGAGYRATFNRLTEDLPNQIYTVSPHGFLVQMGFMKRQNDPPTATCAVQPASIKQDETAMVRVSAVDPDLDPITISWSTSGAKLTGSGEAVTFDATGAAPGDYTVTASVSDDHGHTSTCSSKITVIKKNLPPTVKCEPATASLIVGESVTIRCQASDPNNDPLTYAWTAGSEKLAATGATITFGSAGRQPGTYAVMVTVSDGEFTANSTTTVTVREKPNVPPTIQCQTTTVDVASGSTAELRVSTSDPDGDPTTVTWTASAGTVSGTGQTAVYNASGLRAGSNTVTATVEDGRGGRASCTMTVNVSERIVVLTDKGGWFATNRTRLDNIAKAILDDIAVRMNNDPRLRANIFGYTDTSRQDTRVKDLGLKRAAEASKYLQSKGVDASRITTTDGGTTNPLGDNSTADGRKKNRRVEVVLSVR